MAEEEMTYHVVVARRVQGQTPPPSLPTECNIVIEMRFLPRRS